MTTASLHEEDALALVGCAVAARRFPELGLEDPVAEAMIASLDLDPRRFDERRLRAAVGCSQAVDAIVREFFSRHPSGLAVAVHQGLCTRFTRLDNGRMHWLDLEPNAVAHLKRRLFEPSHRHVIARCCGLDCEGWMRSLRATSEIPTLLIAQGAFRRAPDHVRDRFLTRISRHLPAGTELVVDHDAERPLRPTSIDATSSSLAIRTVAGEWARYPRLRFVPQPLAASRVLAKVFGARRFPDVLHLRMT